MSKYDDITLIRFTENFLSDQEKEAITKERSENIELHKRIIKYEKTIDLLKKFAEVLNQKKKSKKKTEKLPSNIVKIADFLKNKKIA